MQLLGLCNNRVLHALKGFGDAQCDIIAFLTIVNENGKFSTEKLFEATVKTLESTFN